MPYRLSIQIKGFRAFRHQLKNWPGAVLYYLGIKPDLVARHRDGRVTRLEHSSLPEDRYLFYSELLISELGANALDTADGGGHLEFRFRGKSLRFEYLNRDELRHSMSSLSEVFYSEIYSPLQVEGRTVVDIGANIGDSAIYFVLRGASRVVAFEPFPGTFGTASSNLRVNQMTTVVLRNAGLGVPGHVRLDPALRKTTNLVAAPTSHGKEIEFVSLDDVVQTLGASDAAIKIDCEGCEYETIEKASNATLRAFDQIMVEYHSLGYSRLRDKLRGAGFRVRVLSGIGRHRRTGSGVLLAIRQDR